MEMNQREFSDLFRITHVAVVKWEKSHDKPAKMQMTTQIAIRLHILDDLIKDDKEFRMAYHNITSLVFHSTVELLEIDAQTDLIAI